MEPAERTNDDASAAVAPEPSRSGPSRPRRKSVWKRAFKAASRALILRLIPFLALALWLVGRTWRIRITNWGPIEELKKQGHTVIYAIGHGRMLVHVAMMRNQGVRVLISEHFDGELITRVIECFGFSAARGSATRGGAKALRDLLREARRFDLAVTPDGPRGPALSVKPGLPYLAAKTGCAIIAASFDASWKLEARSWDRYRVPLPFARVHVVAAPPRFVPRKADEARLEEERLAVERDLAAAEAEARRLVERSSEDVRRDGLLVDAGKDDLVFRGENRPRGWKRARASARKRARA